MSIDIFNGERSEESIQFEKLFTSQSNKESFASVEKTKNFLSQIENIKPYAIGDDVKLKSEIKEQAFEGMQVFTLNDQKSQKQKVILYIHGGLMGKPASQFPLVVHG